MWDYSERKRNLKVERVEMAVEPSTARETERLATSRTEKSKP